MAPSERDDLITLSLVPGLGPTRTRRCLEVMGSAAAVLASPARQLAAIDGLGPKMAAKIRREIDQLADGEMLAREKSLMQCLGVQALAPEDEGYPSLLRHIPDPPPLLYVRGDLLADDAVAVAIVGSRRCTHYGREQADRLAMLCSQAGLCVVSGGAYGIDSAAHRGIIRTGGRTIAVLGSGIARPYPEKHAELFDQIVAGHGAVVSELPMSCPAMAENFPRRNRIISGLALGVLVVEAALRSGALITARLCAEEHGREVMALPGRADSPNSAGCHKLIRQAGATLVTDLADILDALGETGELLKATIGDQTPPQQQQEQSLFEHNLTDSQRRIVDALVEPRSLDQLAAATGLAVQAIQADLTLLQIRGTVAKGGAMFSRKR